MQKPIKTELVKEHNAVRFFYPDNKIKEYYIKGSIVWPEKHYAGYALIGGQDLDDKSIWIFEEWSFYGVRYKLYEENIEGKIIDVHDRGLISFFDKAWEKYFCRTFYVIANQKVHKHWRLQIHREFLIDPKPYFPKVELPEEGEGVDNLIISYGRNERLKIPADMELLREVEAISDPSELEGKIKTFSETAQALQALRCLLAGFEKAPWRMPAEEDEDEI